MMEPIQDDRNEQARKFLRDAILVPRIEVDPRNPIEAHAHAMVRNDGALRSWPDWKIELFRLMNGGV